MTAETLPVWDTIGAPAASVLLQLLGMAFVSSIEAALAGVSSERARHAADLPNARALDYWVAYPGKTLVTLHLLRLGFVIGIAVGALRLVGAAPFGLPDYAVVGLVSVVVVTLGVLIPRAVGKRYDLRWACATIRIVRVAAFVLTPIVWPVVGLMRLVALALGVPAPARRTAAFWMPEDHASISAATRVRALKGENEDLLRSIIEFSDTIVQEIMVPRTDMVALPAHARPEDVRRAVVETGHSRIPVYEETVDNILGLLYVKDLSASPPDDADFDLKAYVRRVFYVPEVMKISELLREFQKRKTHLAIVVDEYGGTAGLITLEDIIEEIVGEIQDEYDVEEKQYRVIGDSKIIADGRVSIWDLEETLGVEFPDGGGYETLAGFLTARAGYLPQKGAVLAWKELRFTIKEANDRRIGMVEIERLPSEARI